MKASKVQRELMERFYNQTCFEFMHMDDVRASDHEGFVELWDANCRWLDYLVAETRGMITAYKNKHEV